MGMFEQYPWLLIPVIVLTVECWNALKAVALGAMRRANENAKGRVE